MHRFYVPPTDISSDTIRIRAPERHHLLNVLRLKPGDDVQIYDGEGNSYIARLTDTESPLAIASIQGHQFHSPIPPRITLFQAIPKSDKMDLIVQKAAEIGVDAIVPMICERSVPRREQRRPTKTASIAGNESRLKPPSSADAPGFPNFTNCEQSASALNRRGIVTCRCSSGRDEAERHIKNVLRNHHNVESIGLFIGPEGGFSEAEVKSAIKVGCLTATFGSNTLRTETAAIVAVALAIYELRGS